MICATILTLAFVSSSNVYSEESYIVDTASEAKTQAVDCAMNTTKIDADFNVYWNGSNEEMTKYLKRYNIVANLDQLDSYSVSQEILSEDMIP